MSTKKTIQAELVIIAVIVAVILLLSVDAYSRERPTLAVLLARTCVAEIGFQESSQECTLMWAINEQNALIRGRTLAGQTRKFNAIWRSKKQQQRRPWIKFLTDENKPKHWPKNIRWDSRRNRWLGYLKAATEFVSKPGVHPCPAAIDYGAPGEIPKSRTVKIKCMDGAKQWYWGWK